MSQTSRHSSGVLRLNMIEKLLSTNLTSDTITFYRLKKLASLAQTSEDHVSRLGMALSLAEGRIKPDWRPNLLSHENRDEIGPSAKQIKGRTLFKEELHIWMALTLRYQTPSDYEDWRQVLRAHWERGVQRISLRSFEEGDWIRTLNSILPE